MYCKYRNNEVWGLLEKHFQIEKIQEIFLILGPEGAVNWPSRMLVSVVVSGTVYIRDIYRLLLLVVRKIENILNTLFTFFNTLAVGDRSVHQKVAF